MMSVTGCRVTRRRLHPFMNNVPPHTSPRCTSRTTFFGSVLTVDITMDAGMPQFFMAVISAIFCGFLPIYVLIVWTSPFYNGNIAQ